VLPGASPEAVQATQNHLAESVKGEFIAFDDENLQQFADLTKIQKMYKTSSEGKKTAKHGVNDVQSKSDQFYDLEGLLLGMMAIKGS
jgi:hypothetical protein